MMEQGKIDMVLSSRPEDRRAVFEEAAGVTKYKTQKREALRKLEATDANLLRIGDIIKEVKRQIGSLQRQAGKARRYQALHDDLRVLDTHYSRKQLEVLETDLAHCQAEIARLGQSEDLARAKIETDENELAEQRNDLEEIDARIAGSRSELQHLESEINAHRNRIQFNRQRAEELNELIERSRNDIAVAETKREQQSKEIQQANALIEKTSEALQTKETELNQLTGRLSDLRTERSEHESKLETLEKAASEIESRIADLEDEISGLKIRRETTEENRRGLDTAISNIETARTRIQDDTNAAGAAAENLQNKLDRCRGAVQSSEETLRHHQQRVASTEKELAAIERGQAEKESRLEILHEEFQDAILFLPGRAQWRRALSLCWRHVVDGVAASPRYSEQRLDSDRVCSGDSRPPPLQRWCRPGFGCGRSLCWKSRYLNRADSPLSFHGEF